MSFKWFYVKQNLVRTYCRGESMILSKESRGIKAQLRIEDELFYYDNDGIHNPSNTKQFKCNSSRCTVFNQAIILQQHDQKKVFILDKNLTPMKIFESNKVNYFAWNNYVRISIDNNRYILKNDYSLESIKIPFLALSIFDNNIIQINEDEQIYSTDVNGKTNWIYQLDNDNFLLSSFLFIGNKMIMPTDKKNIVVLDIENGTELYKIHDLPEHFIVSSNQENIISFEADSTGHNSLVVINLNNGRIILNKQINNLFFEITPRNSTIKGNKLYFTSRFYRPDPKVSNSYVFPHFGRFDLSTYTIDWIEKVANWKQEGQWLDAPIIINNHAFLRGSDENAYIYEIE